MALTAEQQAEFDKVQASVNEVKAAVQEIQGVVYDSLSIQNVGGSHIYNLGVALNKKLDGLQAELDALKDA
ncbi:hypothetical protein D3C76_1057000 [compost metagenome]